MGSGAAVTEAPVMPTDQYYTIPPDSLDWNLEQKFTTKFRWEYQDGRESLLSLYEKGKIKQWNASERIDWSQELDPENPEQMGIIGYCDTDVEQLSANDQVVAEQFDRDIRARMREIASVAAG